MTKKEAVAILKSLQFILEEDSYLEIAEATEMAIKALVQETKCEDCKQAANLILNA